MNHGREELNIFQMNGRTRPQNQQEITVNMSFNQSSQSNSSDVFALAQLQLLSKTVVQPCTFNQNGVMQVGSSQNQFFEDRKDLTAEDAKIILVQLP